MQATEDLENMEEAEKHMTNGLAQFESVEKAGDEGDYAIVSEKYLEPLRLQFHEPDWSKLDRKPEKPPVPQVSPQFFSGFSLRRSNNEFFRSHHRLTAAA